jgi:pyruvate/2-oxoglutarate dehydrogenase complex dihydrolipoamide dehydrogenase (E3) component
VTGYVRCVAETFDAVVVGMGPGGEVVAERLLRAGRRVAVVERELIGGECAYWACIPSKTVLRPPAVVSEAARVDGVSAARLAWEPVRAYRDEMVRHLDDSAQVDGYRSQGAEVVKGAARLAGPGRVRVGDRELVAAHVVVATGSEPVVPPIEGLDGVAHWTSRDVHSAADLPGRAVVVGGSAVAVETALFLARFGVAVTVVQRSDRLLGREEPRVGALAADHLGAAGVDIRLGARPRRARRDGDDAVLELEGGGEVRGDVVVLATGRRPRTAGLGLEDAGATLRDDGAVAVDDRCRAGDGLWAVGDVTGVAAFTHVAKYQGRVVADNVLGRDRRARYEGIPRVVFGDPEIAAVGLTAAQAAEQGIRTVAAEVELPEVISRPWTYERDPRGRLGLLADADRDVLVGAWAVAPEAGEWIHLAALAVRARIPIDTLLDQVAQFPTWTESYLQALERLDR